MLKLQASAWIIAQPRARCPVKSEAIAQPVELGAFVFRGMPQFESVDDRRQSEFPLADQRLWIDGKKRRTAGGEHVSWMQILMQQHLLALTVREPFQQIQRRADMRLGTGPSGGFPTGQKISLPLRRFLPQAAERRACRDGQLPKKVQIDRNPVLRPTRGKCHTGYTPLDQQRMAPPVMGQQLDRTGTVPMDKRIRLPQTFRVRPLQFQNSGSKRRFHGHCVGDMAKLVRLSQRQIPYGGNLFQQSRKISKPWFCFRRGFEMFQTIGNPHGWRPSR